MKKNMIFLVAIVFVVVIIWWFKTGGSFSGNKVLRNYAVLDVAQIEKITIGDTEGGKVGFFKNKNGKWAIENSHFLANEHSIELIMEAFKSTVIRQDLNDDEAQNVLKQLLVRHKKVSLYKKSEKKPFKTWFIGGATPNHLGTYMLLQNGDLRSERPHIVYIPTFRGTVDARFFTDVYQWRYTGIYHHRMNDIQSIEIDNQEDTSESFFIKRNADEFELYDGRQNKLSKVNAPKIAHYLTHFKKLHYNSVVQELSQNQIDSVFQTPYHYKITLTEPLGKSITTYIVRKYQQKQDETGETSRWDSAKAYAYFPDKKELWYVQYHSWDHILKPLSYFKAP